MEIRGMEARDWPQVARVYEEGIATGIATFQTCAPPWESWNAAHLPVCRLCAWENGTLCGWTALSPVSARPVYRGVAEVSIYIAAAARGRGIGRALLTALIAESERCGFWTLQSVIQRENGASLALHRGCGFRTVGFRDRIGRDAQGVWRDTFLLERRKKED